MIDSLCARIFHLVEALVSREGHTKWAAGAVTLFRANSALASVPVREPSILIVCQRAKVVSIENAASIYQHHYVVLPAALPLDLLLQSGHEELTFVVLISIDLKVGAELALALDGLDHELPTSDGPIAPTPLNDELADVLLRLLHVIHSHADVQILGPGMMRELLYRVLTGPQGGAVHSALGRQRQLGRIGKTLRRIHASYNRPLDVATLASEAGMSIGAFHSHFKAATQTTPMQYLKTTRLQKARLLMIQDGVSATTAARLVGYESTSQFSREFKRLFGRTPTSEAATIKNTLTPLKAEHPPAQFVWLDLATPTAHRR